MEQKGALFLYSCESCLYYSNKKANYMRHLTTDKHKIKQNKAKTSYFYKCNCGKEYTLSGSFSNHKKTCKFFVNKQEKNDNTEILLEKLEEQNKKIEQLEQTIIDKPTNQYITNNDNSTTNNKFNLNIFLNEKCRDAINIIEFQQQVIKAITDISTVINLSNTNGITNAVNITYNNLDDYEKPYYSLDKSRQQMVIKNKDNEWVKDRDVLYNIVEPLSSEYTKNQLDKFYNQVIDKANLTDKEEDKFTEVVLNTTQTVDKDKLCKNIIKNGLNPKTLIK